MMNRFNTGLVTGGLLAVVGMGLLMSDGKTRKRVAKDSKRAIRKAGDFIEDMTDMF